MSQDLITISTLINSIVDPHVIVAVPDQTIENNVDPDPCFYCLELINMD